MSRRESKKREQARRKELDRRRNELIKRGIVPPDDATLLAQFKGARKSSQNSLKGLLKAGAFSTCERIKKSPPTSHGVETRNDDILPNTGNGNTQAQSDQSSQQSPSSQASLSEQTKENGKNKDQQRVSVSERGERGSVVSRDASGNRVMVPIPNAVNRIQTEINSSGDSPRRRKPRHPKNHQPNQSRLSATTATTATTTKTTENDTEIRDSANIQSGSRNSSNYSQIANPDGAQGARDEKSPFFNGSHATGTDVKFAFNAVKRWNFGEYFPIELTADDLQAIQKTRRLKPVEEIVLLVRTLMFCDDMKMRARGASLFFTMCAQNRALQSAENRTLPKPPKGPVPVEFLPPKEFTPPVQVKPAKVAEPVETDESEFSDDEMPIEYIPRLPHNGRGPMR